MTQKNRTNRHRLLHTLVISSVLALDGCGTSAPPATTAPAAAAGGEAVSRREPAPSAPEVSANEPDAALPEARIAAADVRYCDRGWPTTKGGGNPAPICQAVTDADGTVHETCEDQDGPCVRRPE